MTQSQPTKDGTYMFLLSADDGRVIIEIAPWQNGRYQGGNHMAVYYSDHLRLAYWACLPPFPPELLDSGKGGL